MGRFREEFVDSMHLKPNDFVRRLDLKEEEGILLTPWPKQGEFGKNFFSIDSCIRSLMPLLDRRGRKAGE